MKRFIIPTVLLIAVGCTKSIDFDFSRVEPELMVVGWLDQVSSSQTLYFSISEGGIVRPVKDARVICFVNGKEVADVSINAGSSAENAYQDITDSSVLSLLSDSELSYHQQLPVCFSASLKPGDKVKMLFEANQGLFKASSSELTVLEPVEITKVDTVRVTVHHLDWSEQYFQIRADFPDRKGEDNWYCIFVREISNGTYSFTDGAPNISVTVDSPRNIMDIEDPVLLDGNLSQTEDLIFFDYSGNGSFSCFSDNLFRDGTARLKMNIFPSWYDEDLVFAELERCLFLLHDYDELVSRSDEKCRVEHWLEVHLSHCTRDAYFYLRSFRMVLSTGYYPEIMEPITIPSNVIGGVGFVDIASTDVVRINLPSIEKNYLKNN